MTEEQSKLFDRGCISYWRQYRLILLGGNGGRRGGWGSQCVGTGEPRSQDFPNWDNRQDAHGQGGEKEYKSDASTSSIHDDTSSPNTNVLHIWGFGKLLGQFTARSLDARLDNWKDRNSSSMAMFSVRTTTSDGTFRLTGAKFRMALIPA